MICDLKGIIPKKILQNLKNFTKNFVNITYLLTILVFMVYYNYRFFMREDTMANIKPFKAYFYNSAKVGDVSTVVAPTRYNISDDIKSELYKSSEYNAIRLFDGKSFDDDNETSNKYTRSAEFLNEWIKNDILVRDSKDAIYLYEETVEMNGNKYQNMTFVALLEIEELGGDIRMCEEIQEISRNDRYDLLKATNSDISIISCLYINHDKRLLSMMNTLSQNKRDIEFDSIDFDMYQRIWRITDKKTIAQIEEIIEGSKLYIIDGQTRYMTCLEYRDYMRNKNPHHTGDEPYNYTMVSLFDSTSDGVAIMPEHRMIKLPNGFSEDFFVAVVQDHFKIEKIIVDTQDESITETMKKQIKTKRLETKFAVYCGGNYFYRLTLTDPDYIKNELLPDMSKAYCSLDTVVLRKLIINDIFGIEEDYADFVSTSISTTQCIKAIETGDADLMVVMNPVKVQQIQEVTNANETLPFRSLSMFPKPSVGSFINIKD